MGILRTTSDNCLFDALDKQFTLDEIKTTVQSLKRNIQEVIYQIYSMQYWIPDFTLKFGRRELLYQYLRNVIDDHEL